MGLALVVVEEHAGRAMHLRDDHPLGTVDHEGAVVGHERDIAHVDILLLDVLDRLGAGFLVDIENDQAQGHLERRGIGHPALAALVDVVFWRFELVFHEFEHRRIGEVGDREHRLEHRLQPLIGPPADRFFHQEELIIRCLLNLDEVRHFRDFLDFPEKLANALATGKRLRHLVSLAVVEPSGPERLSGRPPSIATVRTAVRAPLSGAIPPPPNRRLVAAG